MDSKVGLKKYIAIEGKWRFVPVLWVNGQPRPDTVVIGGKPVKHKLSGTFYLDWREDGKRVQKPCGTGGREALDAWRTKVAAQLDPEAVADEGAEPDGRATIDDAIAFFLRGVRASKAVATYQAYERDLRWFRRHCSKSFVAQVGRQEILALFAAGREEERHQKTINKKVIVSLMALRNAGSTVQLKKGDWPRTINPEVETYEPEELAAFFASCDHKERVLFATFLSTGFRSREMATLTWPDISYRAGTLSVREKPEINFAPKNYEQRTVSVPMTLIQDLRDLSKESTSILVFPSPAHPTRRNYGGSSPDAHHLELCKKIAFRGGLNCGRCRNSKGERCAEGPTCNRWWLHKFRATCATELLQSGIDIRSVMSFLGHKNLKTTERYLAKLRQSSMRERIETSSIARMIG